MPSSLRSAVDGLEGVAVNSTKDERRGEHEHAKDKNKFPVHPGLIHFIELGTGQGYVFCKRLAFIADRHSFLSIIRPAFRKRCRVGALLGVSEPRKLLLRSFGRFDAFLQGVGSYFYAFEVS